MLSVTRSDALLVCRGLGAQLPDDISDADLLSCLLQQVKIAAQDDLFIESMGEENDRLNGLLDDMIVAKGNIKIVEVEAKQPEEQTVREQEEQRQVEEPDVEQEASEPVIVQHPGVIKKQEKEQKTEAKQKNRTRASNRRKVKKGRSYYAGYLLAKYGAEVDITDDLVSELDSLVGQSSHATSLFDLRSAKRHLRGYLDYFKEQRNP